jgi:hypothetical protein
MAVETETGENLEKMAHKILNQPPDVVERVKKVLPE